MLEEGLWSLISPFAVSFSKEMLFAHDNEIDEDDDEQKMVDVDLSVYGTKRCLLWAIYQRYTIFTRLNASKIFLVSPQRFLCRYSSRNYSK